MTSLSIVEPYTSTNLITKVGRRRKGHSPNMYTRRHRKVSVSYQETGRNRLPYTCPHYRWCLLGLEILDNLQSRDRTNKGKRCSYCTGFFSDEEVRSGPYSTMYFVSVVVTKRLWLYVTLTLYLHIISFGTLIHHPPRQTIVSFRLIM